MLTLKARGSDGTEKASVEALAAKKTESLLGEMDHGEVKLTRSGWRDLDAVLDRRDDELVVEREDAAVPFFAGRFDADERGDGSVTVALEGFERDAKDAQPTGGNVVYQNVPDSEIIRELVGRVPTLEAGEIETLASNLSMSFSHAAPSKALRDVAEATGGELWYRYDGTVDYVDRRGRDRDGTLSPGNQTLIGSLTVTEDVRQEVTHVQGFGAQSGPEQVTAEAVGDSYTGGRQIWREYTNKDVKEVSRLQRIVDRLVAEYDGEPRHLKVEATVEGERLALGDRAPVSIPAQDVDRELRILERTHALGDVGDVLELTLSNREATMRNDSRESRKDLQRFNRGFGGLVVRDTAPYGPEPVGDGNPREIVVPNWPDDILQEISVDLIVQGDAWRSPIQPQPHDHDVTIDVDDHSHDVSVEHPAHSHEVATTSSSNDAYTTTVHHDGQSTSATSGGSWVTLDSASISSDTAEVYCVVTFYTTQSAGSTALYLRVYGGGEYYPGSRGVETRLIEAYRPVTAMVVAPNNLDNETVYAQINTPTNETVYGIVNWFASGPHTHGVSDTSSTELGFTQSETSDAGGGFLETATSSETTGATPAVVTEFGGEQYYPSDVEISVNGSTVTTLEGDPDGRWSETVDLRGELRPGDNVIAADPTQRGELNMIMATELFREGRRDE